MKGWQPWRTTLFRPEVRAKACRRGGLVSGKARHRQMVQRVKARIAPLLTHRWFQDLDAEAKAAVMVAVGKAFRLGEASGYQQGYRGKTQGSGRKAA